MKFERLAKEMRIFKNKNAKYDFISQYIYIFSAFFFSLKLLTN